MTGAAWRKYPRTPHHPTSPGVGDDDRLAPDPRALDGVEVVITEKMDGENTTLYRDGFHARSLDSRSHPARSVIAALQARVADSLPEGRRLCGENLFARHAIPYDALPDWFLGFSVWDDDHCLGWDETVQVFADLGITPVPVLWRGAFSDAALTRVVAGLDLTRQEGVVVRREEGFGWEDFDRSVMKWVRKGHVQTDTHWSRGPIIPNGLAG